MRAETTATVVSAIFAAASAIAALIALVFSAHQETVAKQQLEATYLTNLYDRQVDGFIAVQNAFVGLERTDLYGKISSYIRLAGQKGTHAAASQSDLHYDVKRGYDEWRRALDDLTLKLQALSIVTPLSFQSAERDNLLYSDDLSALMYRLHFDEQPSPDQTEQWFEQIIKSQGNYGVAKQGLLGCAQTILRVGKPMTEETLAICRKH